MVSSASQSVSHLANSFSVSLLVIQWDNKWSLRLVGHLVSRLVGWSASRSYCFSSLSIVTFSSRIVCISRVVKANMQQKCRENRLPRYITLL